MTGMPRLAQAKPVSWNETSVLIFFIFGIFSLLRRAMSCHPTVKLNPTDDFLWIPISLIHEVLGSLLFIAGTSKAVGTWAIRKGKSITQRDFVLTLGLFLGVKQASGRSRTPSFITFAIPIATFLVISPALFSPHDFFNC